jgi:hypothetical protein
VLLEFKRAGPLEFHRGADGAQDAGARSRERDGACAVTPASRRTPFESVGGDSDWVGVAPAVVDEFPVLV